MADVLNVHERRLAATTQQLGALIDGLSSPGDRLWPRHLWPRMSFDRPLAVGADGGHGPIRYEVERYEPGHAVWFRFKGPKGFHGGHGLEMEAHGDGTVTLRHVLRMRTDGPARLTWPLIFRCLHDALVEDALDCAEAAIGRRPAPQPWSVRVRMLRWLATGGKARPQATPIAALR